MVSRNLLLALTVGALGATTLWAQEEEAVDLGPRWAAWQFYWENDAYAAFSGSDEFYTNGVRFAWLRNPNVVSNPEWSRRLVDWWCRSPLCFESNADIGYGHALGQSFYTPNDITDPRPQPEDRPWAGYLYYSWVVQATHATDVDFRLDRPVQNLFELQVGLVGPAAGAEFAQREVHEIIDDDLPLGWDNQLVNEPTVNLNYTWRKKLGNTTFDIVPHWGGSLGTVMTAASAGATVRLGRNISSFPQLLITPTNASLTVPRPTKCEYYLFAGAEGRAVAHNIFLDGNVFRDGPEIDVRRDTFVYDLKAGFAARYKSWRLDYTFVRRSEEFAPPPGRADGVHDFGSVTISYSLWRPADD
jgi:lipid A 3-O-deacylase